MSALLPLMFTGAFATGSGPRRAAWSDGSLHCGRNRRSRWSIASGVRADALVEPGWCVRGRADEEVTGVEHVEAKNRGGLQGRGPSRGGVVDEHGGGRRRIVVFFKHKTAYEIWLWLEFRRVLFR